MKQNNKRDPRAFRLVMLFFVALFWAFVFLGALLAFVILDWKIPVYITIGVAILFGLAIFVFAIRVHRENQAEILEAEKNISEQLEALAQGNVRIVPTKWRSIPIARLQNHVNTLIANLSSAASASIQKKKKNGESDQILSLDAFRGILNQEVRTSPYYRSALLLARIDGPSPDEEAKKNLVAKLRASFEGCIIGTYSDRAFLLYVPMPGSALSLKMSCEKIIATYNDAYVDPISSKLEIRRVKIGGAVYPNVPLPQLIIASEKELEKEGDLNLCESSPRSTAATSAISEGEKRAKHLAEYGDFQKRLLASESSAARTEILTEAVSTFLSSFGFEAGGVLAYDSSTLSYDPILEVTSSSDKHSFSLLGHAIDPAFIDPFYEAGKGDHSFFVTDISMLPNTMVKTLQSLGVETLYAFALESDGKKLGVFYLSSSTKMDSLSLTLKENITLLDDLILYGMTLSSLSRERDLQLDLLYALGAKSNRYVYMVNRSSMRIVAIGQNLRKKCPTATPGELCYKTLVGRDSPCEDCPLRKGAVEKSVPALSNAPIHASLVPFAGTSKNYATVLFEKQNAASFGDNHLYDPNTLVKNGKAFNLDLTREVRSEGHGFVFALRFNNASSLVKQIPGATIDGLVRIVAQQAQDAGYDDLVYRNDETILSFLLRDYTKDKLYSFAEEIASLLSGSLPFERTFFQGDFSYSAISYPVEASTTVEMDSLIHSELARSAEAGSGRVSEVGLRSLRKALRHDYIEECLEDSLKRGNIPYTLQPILSPENNQPIFIDTLIHLEGLNHETIHGVELSSISAEKNLVVPLDVTGVIGVAKFFQSYTDLLLRKNGLRGIAYYAHENSMLADDFAKNIASALSGVRFPKSFGYLEFDASLAESHFEKVHQDILDTAPYGLSFIAIGFDPDRCSPSRVAEAGIKIVKTAPNLIKNAVLNESSASAFIKMMRDFDSLGISVIVSGVENEAMKKFATDIGAYAMQGNFLSAPLNETGAVRYLSYGR